MNAFRSVAFVLMLGGFAAAGGCRAEGVEGVEGAEGVKLDASVTPLLQDGHAPASVLVYLKGKADLTASKALATPAEKGSFVYRALAEKAQQTQGPLRAWLGARGANFRSFHIINAVVVYDATPALVREIAARADVERVTLDKPFNIGLPGPGDVGATVDPPEANAVLAPGSNLVAAGAVQVWNEFNVRGAGVVVAGQDTGVDWTHPALRNHYRGKRGNRVDHRYNWHDAIHAPVSGGNNPCGYDTAAPCDDNGHGTHTVGSIVGDDAAGNQIGMAPAARWIGCRNMDEGVGTPSRYIECFEWFLAPYPPGGNPLTDGDPTLAPDVINNSWGCPTSEGCQGQEIVPVLQTLNQAGIVVVVSAGNEGPSCGTINDQPATASSSTLSVGAYSHTSGAIASFSSRGPSDLDGQPGPDVSAPGVSIRSCVPGGGYSSAFSGTSMAGPHVVGEVALLLSADPTLRGNVEEITNIVRTTATPRTSTQTCGGVPGSAVPNNTFGFGTINAHAAVSSRFRSSN
ncbi:MAG: S8 family serine peptidase [Polyangiaceae bacterium]|nr:S8 family serine peptidase [Polyangiaceae bacterium]